MSYDVITLALTLLQNNFWPDGNFVLNNEKEIYHLINTLSELKSILRPLKRTHTLAHTYKSMRMQAYAKRFYSRILLKSFMDGRWRANGLVYVRA